MAVLCVRQQWSAKISVHRFEFSEFDWAFVANPFDRHPQQSKRDFCLQMKIGMRLELDGTVLGPWFQR
jgi:hypothetical protein